jgi:hypothetical protein
MTPQPILVSLSPAGFAASKQRLVSAGVAVPDGDSGSLAHEGVTVACEYNGTDTLTVSVTHKPGFVSEGFVENKIREWFAEAVTTGEAQCHSQTLKRSL